MKKKTTKKKMKMFNVHYSLTSWYKITLINK